MSKVKDFRDKCEEARTPWKRAAVIHSFLREDLLPEKQTSKFSIGKRKSNTQIVIDELGNYMKKYKDFFIFGTLAESPTIGSEKELQKLFTIFIKEIKKINKGRMDRATINVTKRFIKILDENNFLEMYLMFRSTAKESMTRINDLVNELVVLELIANIEMKNSNDEHEGTVNNNNIDDNEVDDSRKRSNQLRREIHREREKLGSDLLDPFFELANELIQYIKSEKEANPENIELQNKLDARMQLLFNYMYEDLSEFYEYVYKFDGPIQIFFEDPKDTKNAKECINLYEFLMEINIFSFQGIEGTEIPDFQNLVDGIKKSFIPNISWTLDEYKDFFERCKTRDIDIPLAFLIIDSCKGMSKEQDELFNEFLVDNKEEYMIWCLFGDKGYYDYKFQNKKIYTDNDINVYTIIVDELIKRQSDKNIRLIDIRNAGTGSTASTTKIGDYIIKCGLGRYVDNIPNHRRILQPIIREMNENAFFEVADVVDMDVTLEELNQVFYEMLEDGLAWADAGLGNIGRLKRKNVPRHGIKRATKTEDGILYIDDSSESDEVATGITGKASGEPLEAGECVIIDTDLVFDLRTIDREQFERIVYPKYMSKEMIMRLKAKYMELHAGSGGASIETPDVSIDSNPEER